MSLELIQNGWRKKLWARAREASELLIVCPFIKTGVIEELLRITSAQRISVVTRLNTADFYDRVSDIAAIRLLLENGHKVRALQKLHTKLYIFDDNTAILGSANLTDAALDTNFELGFKTTDEDTVFECMEYFDELWDFAKHDVTEKLIEDCEANLKQASPAEPPQYPKGLKDYGTAVIRSAPRSNISQTASEDLSQKSETIYLHYLELLTQLEQQISGICVQKNDNGYIIHKITDKAADPTIYVEFSPGLKKYPIRLDNRASYHDPEKWLTEKSSNYGHLRNQFDFNENTDLDYAVRLIKSSYEYVLSK